MKLTKRILFVFFSTLTTVFSYSQNDSLFNLKIIDLQNLFNSSSYQPIDFNDTSLMVIREISSLKSNKANYYKSDYIQKQLELTKKDYGLSFQGGYVENFSPDVADINDNLIYNRRFQAGFEWSILKNGYFDSKVKAQILEDRLERERLKMQSSAESAYYLERFDKTIYVFNLLKIELLNKRKEDLIKQYNLLKDFVYLKKLPKEDLIRIETRLAEVNSLLGVYKSYNDYLIYNNDSLSFEDFKLPLIDLNYEKIFTTIQSQTDSLLGKNVYQDYYKWYHLISAKPFVRYNYFNLIDNNQRAFFAAGVNITIPIPFNTKLENEVIQEKWNYDNEQMIANRNSVYEDVLNVAYEFRYKLKQFIGFYQKRKLMEEKLRIEKVKVKMGDRNIDPLGGLDLMDDIARVDIELIDLVQNLYIKALKIHSKMPNSKIEDIVSCESIQSINEYEDRKVRSVYVWSKVFGHHSTTFLAEYCTYNKFEKVVLAISLNDTLKKEKEEFVQFLKPKTQLYLMIGNNKMFYENDINSKIDEIIQLYNFNKVEGIHIDIEPHTFDDFKDNKVKLLNDYVEMIGKISSYCESKNLKLEISITLNYPEDIVDRLFPVVDKIYFMCYENVKDDYIKRKIITYTDNNAKKIEIALRTEDFDSRIDLENKIDTLEKITNIHSFSYHDLYRIIEMDKKNIEKNR